ncbi:MAG: hypothetical protein M3203_13600, partial [Actinomycetota bacterium]|nr:hypothetical protein [Actinomycetota bacterium]
FHYGLIEGSVTVAGQLSPAEHWFVAVAGNVAGALLGLALVAAGAAGVRLPRPARHVLILGGLLQLGFHLVLYPLLSLSAQVGDWRVIYDFDATPALSAATAAVHVAALTATWAWWRSSGRRTLFNVDHGLDAEVARLEAAVAASPGDADPAIELAVLYARNGEAALARETLEAAARDPRVTGADAARLHLLRARLAMIEDRWNQAYMAAREGLAAMGDGNSGADELAQRLWANAGLALASMDRPEQALAALAQVHPPVLDDPRVRYARGLARLACGDRAGGEADLRSVVGWRPEGDLLRQWAEAQLEGREPPPPDDRDRPNYARRTKAPPAPIAGV